MGRAAVGGRRIFVWVLVLAGLGAGGCGVTPQTPPPGKPWEFPKLLSRQHITTYTRSMQREPDTFVMESAARTFRAARGERGKEGTEVVLLGAVHVGTAAYYEELQRRMDAADLVLFEQVTDEKHPPEQLTAEQRARKVQSSAYQKLADLTGLTAQAAQIRYDRAHFRRCDMTIQELHALLEAEAAGTGPQREAAVQAMQKFAELTKMLDGGSWLVNFSMWVVGMNDAAKAQVRLQLALSGEDRTKLDKQLTPRLARLIVEDRNAHVVKELGSILSERPGLKRVVVFYGSQHLAGIEKGLRGLGYTSVGPGEWLEAVACHPYAEGLPDEVVQEIIQNVHNAE